MKLQRKRLAPRQGFLTPRRIQRLLAQDRQVDSATWTQLKYRFNHPRFLDRSDQVEIDYEED